MTANADPFRGPQMIQLQTQKTRLPTAAGRRDYINLAALAASAVLVAQILSACAVPLQSFSTTGGPASYPYFNDPQPAADVRAAELAQLKAELIRIRDDHQRVAVQQQAFTQVFP